MEQNRIFLVTMGVTATLIAVFAGLVDGAPFSDIQPLTGLGLLVAVYLMLLLIDMNNNKPFSIGD